ncbi:hypothetical protein V7x_09430 [Crateriforma conspicua]|uniref:Uncharacterized protein n=1 Tax=Crateriforma conspicua TaxID=2527996 RepID=A0A5C6FSV7_9PLAN|nr:hypothetical protein V7x_09430 [Crateriforma conspicua]
MSLRRSGWCGVIRSTRHARILAPASDPRHVIASRNVVPDPIPLTSYPMNRDVSDAGPLDRLSPTNARRSRGVGCCFFSVVAIVTIQLGWSPTVTAGEPSKRFLDALRQAGYFDMATAYLDRIDRYPGIDPQWRQSIDLERAQVFVDSALSARQADEQENAFRLAEEQLQAFIKKYPDHSRTSEARLQLGRLQLVRAGQLLAADPTPQQREQARSIYQDAAVTFDTITENLRDTLRDMRGQKIDAAKEPEKVAQRDRFRYEFLQAQLSSGEARLSAAKTYDDPSKQGGKLLERAESQFSELMDKYGDYVPGALAAVSRGQVQQVAGKFEAAKASYLEMLEQPEADPLREGKIKAITGLLQIATDESSADFPVVLDRAKRIADSLRPNEAELPAVQDFRLALADAHLSKSKDESINATIRKRHVTDARRLLLAAEKVAGTHQAAVKERLAEIGIERSEIADVEIDTPASIDDAVLATRQILDQVETLTTEVQKLTAAKASEDQIRNVEKALTTARTKGIEMLTQGLGLVDQSTDLNLANDARQYLTYLLLQERRYRETAAVGSFTAYAAPGTEIGKTCGLWALSALQQLLVESGDDINDGLASQVRTLGSYLTKTWPGDPQTAQAQGVMIRIALRKDKWDDAETLINELPDGPEKGAMKRLAGQVFFTESSKLRRDQQAEAADAMRQRSIGMLGDGLDAIVGKLVAPEAIAASLALAKAQLRSDAPDDAVKTLRHPVHGPITTVGKVNPPTESFLTDVYATELNALVALLKQDVGNLSRRQDLFKQIDAAMTNLRQAADKSGAKDRLTNTLFTLARDLRDDIESAAPNQRDGFITAFELFLQRIGATANDPDIIQWVAQESLTLGESLMQPGEQKATGRSLKLIQTASDALDKLAEKEAKPSAALRFQRGRASRLLGNYSAALDAFQSVLSETPQMLNAQVEAALTYEQWAGSIRPALAGKAYSAAMLGGRPGEDGKNTIWGWGKISSATSRSPKFRDTFFEARYHVALCRFLMGKATNDNRVIQQAIRDITQVHAIYPDMGGPAQKKKFNVLLKRIQTAAGVPAVGLEENK